MKIKLQHVRYMPKELQVGVLYVSEEFSTAAHLCACGCGTKVRTPLGPTDWALDETLDGPSLYPSIGNWQLPCQSHYWIQKGTIEWAESWNPTQIAAGRRQQEEVSIKYYESRQPCAILRRIWSKVKRYFREG